MLEGLNFANGLTLSPDEDFLLVLESGRGRIWRYHLTGEMKDIIEVFSVLPGVVDNITPNGDGGYLVGILMPMSLDGHNKIIHYIRSFYPIARLLVRLMRMIQLSFQFLNDYILQSDLMETLGNIQN